MSIYTSNVTLYTVKHFDYRFTKLDGQRLSWPIDSITVKILLIKGGIVVS